MKVSKKYLQQIIKEELEKCKCELDEGELKDLNKVRYNEPVKKSLANVPRTNAAPTKAGLKKNNVNIRETEMPKPTTPGADEFQRDMDFKGEEESEVMEMSKLDDLKTQLEQIKQQIEQLTAKLGR